MKLEPVLRHFCPTEVECPGSAESLRLAYFIGTSIKKFPIQASQNANYIAMMDIYVGTSVKFANQTRQKECKIILKE
jgi:hypothetical protein